MVDGVKQISSLMRLALIQSFEGLNRTKILTLTSKREYLLPIYLSSDISLFFFFNLHLKLKHHHFLSLKSAGFWAEITISAHLSHYLAHCIYVYREVGRQGVWSFLCTNLTNTVMVQNSFYILSDSIR